MKRTFNIDEYTITTYFNLRAKLTQVTIVKDGEVLLDEAIAKPPFKIDYATLIDNL
jgi:hypothetical protein